MQFRSKTSSKYYNLIDNWIWVNIPMKTIENQIIFINQCYWQFSNTLCFGIGKYVEICPNELVVPFGVENVRCATAHINDNTSTKSTVIFVRWFWLWHFFLFVFFSLFSAVSTVCRHTVHTKHSASNREAYANEWYCSRLCLCYESVWVYFHLVRQNHMIQSRPYVYLFVSVVYKYMCVFVWLDFNSHEMLLIPI